MDGVGAGVGLAVNAQSHWFGGLVTAVKGRGKEKKKETDVCVSERESARTALLKVRGGCGFVPGQELRQVKGPGDRTS